MDLQLFDVGLLVVAGLIASLGYYTITLAFPATPRESPHVDGALVGWSPIREMRAAEMLGEPAPLPPTRAERRQADLELSRALGEIEHQLSTDLDRVVRAALDRLGMSDATAELRLIMEG